MHYEVISANCHVDLCWPPQISLPPTPQPPCAIACLSSPTDPPAQHAVAHGRRVQDQFKDPSLKMPQNDYWKRQCWATYQTDPIGIKLVDELGADKIMWGSDYPNPDSVWPDSQEHIERELGRVSASIGRKIVCDNAAALYSFAQA